MRLFFAPSRLCGECWGCYQNYSCCNPASRTTCRQRAISLRTNSVKTSRDIGSGSAPPRAQVPVTFDLFLSFEWLKGLPVAHLLHAALRARAPHARCWFALEQDAASPAAMADGVAASSVFVFLATRGALLKPTHSIAHSCECCAHSGGWRLMRSFIAALLAASSVTTSMLMQF